MNTSERLLEIAGEVLELDAGEDLANRLSDIALEIDENYVLADTAGEIPTNAQAVALARVIRGRWANEAMNVTLQREPFGLPSGYIGFSFVDGYTGGIDREGNVST